MKINYIDNNPEMGIEYDYKLIMKEIKKLGLYPKRSKSDVWNPSHLPFNNAKWFVLMSIRSKGKTTNFLIMGLIMNKLYGTVTQYIVQNEKLLAPKYTKGLYRVILNCDYIRTITGGRWSSIVLKARRWYYCNYDENGKISEMSEEYVCIMSSVDKQEDYKSILNEPKGDLIIYDEFIHNYYMPNEFVEFSQLFSTIRRIRQSPIIIMLSNTVNLYSPYFNELEIADTVRNMNNGDKEIITSSGGTNVYVEIIDPAQSQSRIRSDRMFFGFKNPLLGAITGTTVWALRNFPHIIGSEETKVLSRNHYISYNNKLVNLELVRNEVGLCIYCHWAARTYDDSVIYTIGEIRRPLDKYKVGDSKMDKLIWRLYQKNKFYYGTNDVGGFVEAYINECKSI